MRVWSVLVGLIALASPAAADCIPYAAASVTLTGIIHTRQDTARQDQLYLDMDKPICVVADSTDETAKDVKAMEMMYFVRMPFRDEWLNKHVSVTGTLFGWQPAHHSTSMAIVPTETHMAKKAP